MSERFKSINQISEMLEIDRRTIKKKIQGLQIKSTKGKAQYYDMIEVFEKLSDVDDKNINEQLVQEQLRYEKARADKMILEVEQRRGEVVPTEDVARIVGNEYSNVRARLLSIPSRCAKDLSLELNPSLVKSRLDQEIVEALEELTADKIFEETINEEFDSDIETNSSEESTPITGIPSKENPTEDAKGTTKT